MSLAEGPNTGGVVDEMAARFARQDAARRAELDRLIRQGKGNDEPPRAAWEKIMAKGKGCPECGSRTCHKASCSRRGGAAARPPARATKQAPPAAEPRPRAPTLVRVTTSRLFDAEEATVEQLVETMEACRAELARRKDQVAAQLRAIDAAIGGSPVVVATLRATCSTGTAT